MRRHKTVARIFLFLSIVNFAFAGVAQTPAMHEMRVDLVTGAEDVAEVSERGHTQSEELPEWSGRPSTEGHLHSRRDIFPASSFKEGTLFTDPDDPEAKKFFNKELNRKLKEYVILGSIAGLFTGVTNGIQKEILGTVSPGASTLGRSVEPLNEHRQDQEDLVSRSLSNMRDGDLQMLSILSRRMLNRLD
ncbi:hypothetical protein F5888DRAFT_1720879 [Russula emetica]|nr:hypothetical protein F5888DRAFT_1720879 [Russula emetica]